MAVSLLGIMASFLHLCSWQERLALLLLGYDELVINIVSMLSPSTIPQRNFIQETYTYTVFL